MFVDDLDRHRQLVGITPMIALLMRCSTVLEPVATATWPLPAVEALVHAATRKPTVEVFQRC